MNTGIGQSKYCILQPFSPCLICLCSSLFDFNSIFIFFDWSRSCVIQSCATLIVHCFCSGFSSVSLHCTNILNETLQLSMEGKSLDRGTWESNVTQNQKEVKSIGKCYSWLKLLAVFLFSWNPSISYLSQRDCKLQRYVTPSIIAARVFRFCGQLCAEKNNTRDCSQSTPGYNSFLLKTQT